VSGSRHGVWRPVRRAGGGLGVQVGGGDVLLIGTDRVVDPSRIEFVHAVQFSRETFDDDQTLVAARPGEPVRAGSPRCRPGVPGGGGGLR
jgi:hypothetical protein